MDAGTHGKPRSREPRPHRLAQSKTGALRASGGGVPANIATLGPWLDSLVLGSNVAQVGHFLRSGALPAGFVSLGQLVAMHVPAQQYWVCGEQAHRPIDQGAVVLRGGAAGQLADAFLDFMTGAPVQEQLTDLGYVPVAGASDAPLADPGPLPSANPGPVANE